jgi:hypothetical protein
MAKRPVRIGGDVSLANGKTWKQLEAEARDATRAGVAYWPDVVLQLLAQYKALAERNAELSQPSLLSVEVSPRVSP